VYLKSVMMALSCKWKWEFFNSVILLGDGGSDFMQILRSIRELRASFTTEYTENSQRNTDLGAKNSKNRSREHFLILKIYLRLFVFSVKFVSGHVHSLFPLSFQCESASLRCTQW